MTHSRTRWTIEKGPAWASFNVRLGRYLVATVWGAETKPSEYAAARNAAKVAAVPKLLDLVDRLASMEADETDAELHSLIAAARELQELTKD